LIVPVLFGRPRVLVPPRLGDVPARAGLNHRARPGRTVGQRAAAVAARETVEEHR